MSPRKLLAVPAGAARALPLLLLSVLAIGTALQVGCAPLPPDDDTTSEDQLTNRNGYGQQAGYGHAGYGHGGYGHGGYGHGGYGRGYGHGGYGYTP